jgi:23S rRNA (adenine2030-N6)-methyltransferase
MLSYQHLYHAGNLADVHKHALLAVALDYMVRKDKPLTYLETHAGRGLYDLSAPEALRTGEAAQGIGRVAGWFGADHPYARAIAATRAARGPQAYPGSPLIAGEILRTTDTIHLCELHPQERAALEYAVAPFGAHVHAEEGMAKALSLCPPTPRRGMLLIDPSWEIKQEYETIPRALDQIARKWNVGVIALWYPVLTDGPHPEMVRGLRARHPEALFSEVRFPPARPGHRMVGSGLVVLNAPFGLAEEAARLAGLFRSLR